MSKNENEPGDPEATGSPLKQPVSGHLFSEMGQSLSGDKRSTTDDARQHSAAHKEEFRTSVVKSMVEVLNKGDGYLLEAGRQKSRHSPSRPTNINNPKRPMMD